MQEPTMKYNDEYRSPDLLKTAHLPIRSPKNPLVYQPISWEETIFITLTNQGVWINWLNEISHYSNYKQTGIDDMIMIR